MSALAEKIDEELLTRWAAGDFGRDLRAAALEIYRLRERLLTGAQFSGGFQKWLTESSKP